MTCYMESTVIMGVLVRARIIGLNGNRGDLGLAGKTLQRLFNKIIVNQFNTTEMPASQFVIIKCEGKWH